MYENIGLKGKFRIENTTSGEVREIPNTIINVGISTITSLMLSGLSSANPFDYISLGIGSSTVASSDTTLGSEYLTIQTINSQTTSGTTNDTATLVGSFTIDATKIINEAGVFNASGLDIGSIMARTTFENISAVSGDFVNTTWDISLS